MAKEVQTYKYNNTKEGSGPDGANGKWWDTSDKMIYNDVFAVVRWIRNDQSSRLTNNIRNSRMYANFSPVLSMPIGFVHDKEDDRSFSYNSTLYGAVHGSVKKLTNETRSGSKYK